jgi:hypothetical protein
MTMSKQEIREKLNNMRKQYENRTTIYLSAIESLIEHQKTIDIDYEEIKDDEPKQLPE